MRVVVGVAVLSSSVLLAAGCPASKPGELRPLLQELILPPSLATCNHLSDAAAKATCGDAAKCSLEGCDESFFCQDPAQQAFQEFSVRNVGDIVVKIASVSFEASTSGAGSDAFSGASFDKTQLFKDDVASLSFKYLTPDITKQSFANLVVKSDASNATLTVPVSTAAFLSITDPTCNPSAEGEGEGAGEGEGSAGEGEGSAGEGEGEGSAGEGEGEGAAGEGEGASGEGEGEGGQ